MEEEFREIGSEFHYDLNNIKKITNRNYFRSGRDALRAIALQYKPFYKRILLPALCCTSMVSPFLENGYLTNYYQLKEDLTTDINDMKNKLNKTDIFFYMNYFGSQVLSDENLYLLKTQYPDVLFIQDKTHDFLSGNSSSFIPDYTIVSIRKWIPIPDGGILLSKGKHETFQKNEDLAFYKYRLKAQKSKSEYLRLHYPYLKKLYQDQFRRANEILEQDTNIVDISVLSYRLINLTDYQKIARIRIQNAKVLNTALQEVKGMEPLFHNMLDRPMLYYPVFIENRDTFQLKLAKEGIYCPVIWPLPDCAKGICRVSDRISKDMLALPCDQRYDETDMRWMISVLTKIISD